jgi:hypothetical protein
VVEHGPGSRGGGSSGAATYRALSPQEARIRVRSSRGGIVLIRTSFDPRWRATVDGRATRVLPADYVLQAVPVPPGRHTIVLRYDDPTIGYGLLGSVLALLVLLGTAVTLDIRRRTARRALVAESDPHADPDRTIEAP